MAYISGGHCVLVYKTDFLLLLLLLLMSVPSDGGTCGMGIFCIVLSWKGSYQSNLSDFDSTEAKFHISMTQY